MILGNIDLDFSSPAFSEIFYIKMVFDGEHIFIMSTLCRNKKE